MAEIPSVLSDVFQASIPRGQGYIPARVAADCAGLFPSPVIRVYEPGGKLFSVYRSAHHADGSISRRRHRSSDGEVDPLVVPVSQVHQPFQAVLVHQREVAVAVGRGQDQ